MRATSTRAEAAAFAVDAELGNARFAAVREELNDAGDGIGAVDGAFGAANDFNFVDIVEREAGEINRATRRIYGRTIDEDFGEIGVAAVKEDGGCAAFWSRAANGDACGEGEGIGKADGLAGVDLIPGDDRNRSCSLTGECGLGLRGDNDIGGERFELKMQVELALLIRG